MEKPMKTAINRHQMFIGGRWVDSTGGEVQEVKNPATGEPIATVPKGTAEDVDRAVAGAIEAHGAELARIESDNVGKPLATTISEEIPPIADCFRFFAGAARTLEGRAAGEYMKGFTSFVRRESLGVVGSIAPWNYPLMMAAWKLGPALAAGNTVVLKPSEQTPLTALKLAEVLMEIFPKGRS